MLDTVSCRDLKKVIAIIVSYKSADQTVECLEAIARSVYPFAGVHICENGGADAYDNLVEQLSSEQGRIKSSESRPAQRVLRTKHLRNGCSNLYVHEAEGNLGYAGGVNVCLAALAYDEWDAVLILNPDALIAPDALGALVSHAEDPSYGMIGCRLALSESGKIQMYGGQWRPYIARAKNIGFGSSLDAPVDAPAIEHQMDFVCGAAMLVTRAFVDTVGLMDESYFLYMEEVDWCFRRGKFKLGYAHGAVAMHVHGVSTGASTHADKRSALSIYLNERNKLLFTRRFYPKIYPIAIVTTLLYICLYLRRGDLHQWLSGLSGWLAGLRGQIGQPTDRIMRS
ncbi:glycosyltransferase [Methylobacterium sp. ID0610]|uniref:glycosyltransferase n=1 Tax=Methylobacterium carpenticola TaxID=3344827 RepID=UPI00368E6BA8